MNAYSRRIVWSDEDAAYVAVSPEFAGLSALGETPVAALEELATVLTAAVEVMESEGTPLPEPLVHRGFSGQFRLRVPRILHAQLADRAAAEGVSLNTLAVSLLSERYKGR